jgi:HEAT repeat protein
MKILAAALMLSLARLGATVDVHHGLPPGSAFRQTPAVSPADLAAAIDKLGSLDDGVRSAASRTARRAESALAVPALAKAARDHADGYVRYRALVLLAGFGTPTATETMRAVLGDRNDRLRAVAYAWFAHHPDPAVLPTLLAALTSERSEFVRPALTRALAANGADPRVREALVPLVLKGEDYFRAEVIQALGDYKADYAADAVQQVAVLDGPLQDEAVIALGQIGSSGALATFAELQRKAPRERQPSIAAAICLIGVNCQTHEAYLVDTLKFASANGSYQPLLRSTAHALAVLAVRGNARALGAMLDAAVAGPASRASVSLGIGLVALRHTALVLDVFEKRPDRDAALDVLRDAFDMLEEDFEEEQFYAAVRRAYWEAPEGSARRQLAAAVIQKLEF